MAAPKAGLITGPLPNSNPAATTGEVTQPQQEEEAILRHQIIYHTLNLSQPSMHTSPCHVILASKLLRPEVSVPLQPPSSLARP
jgi:hypothetical protein